MKILNKQAKIDFIINLFYYFAIIILTVILGKVLLKYLFPFVIATVVAFFMQKPARKIAEKLKVNTGAIAAFLSAFFYLIIVVLIGFFAYKAIYYLINFSEYFINKLPKFFANFNLTKFFTKLPDEFLETFNSVSSDMVNTLIIKLTSYISSLAGSVAKGMPSFLLSSVVALVATCYIAKDFTKLSAFLKEICGKKLYKKVLKIKNIAYQSVFKLIKGYLILSVITYVEITIGLLVLKIKYAPIIAAVIGIVDLLPVLGAGTVLIPWAVYEIFFGVASKGIGIAVLYLIVVLVRNFLEPKVISKQIGIYPLFTLISMFIGLKLIGFAGIFIFPTVLIVVIKYYKNELDLEQGLSH